jgi:hypothetical protein
VFGRAAFSSKPKRKLPFWPTTQENRTMPRLTNRLPSYRKHKQSGQAIVTLAGQDFLLGPFGTQASRREYDRVVAEWLARGRQPLVDSDAGLDIAELSARYWSHATVKYVRRDKPTAEQFKVKTVLKHLLRLYENDLAADFAPAHLKVVRQAMIDAGWARKYVNQQIGVLVRTFKWAAVEGLLLHQSMRHWPWLTVCDEASQRRGRPRR